MPGPTNVLICDVFPGEAVWEPVFLGVLNVEPQGHDALWGLRILYPELSLRPLPAFPPGFAEGHGCFGAFTHFFIGGFVHFFRRVCEPLTESMKK